MGNCCGLEKRARVVAWDDDDDDDWGMPAKRSGSSRARGGLASAEKSGGMRVKIRMTKGQLRQMMESAGRRGASDEAVVAEIMSMGTVRVDVAELRPHSVYLRERHRPRPPKLETIQEEDYIDE